MTNQVQDKRAKEGSKDTVQYQSTAHPFVKRAKKLTKEEKESIAKELLVKRNKERVPVRGIFKYHECPGAMFEFMFRKYEQDPIEKYSMMDGEVYTIPLGVARHLNTDCWYPVHKFTSKDSHLTSQEKIRRTSFQSLEFMDEALSA